MKKYYLIFFGIIVFFISMIALSCTKETFLSKHSNVDFIAITYDNSMEPTNTDFLIEQFEKYGYSYLVTGRGTPWEGWYGRLLEYTKAIETMNDDRFVLFCDGRDVLINEYYDTFIEKAVNKYNQHQTIFFGAERLCCVGNGRNQQDIYRTFMENIGKEKTTFDYYYLNFGLCFGKVKDFKHLFQNMNIQKDDADQGLAVVQFYNNHKSLNLDYNQEIFTNNSDKCPLEWDESENKFRHTITNTYPSFLHFPGPNPIFYNKIKEQSIQKNSIWFDVFNG